jgi:6-phosphogluconate dehydrogenase (decarboxylating)
MKTPQQIDFIGLGKMGFPTAGRLAATVFALKVYDLDRFSKSVVREFRKRHSVGDEVVNRLCRPGGEGREPSSHSIPHKSPPHKICSG